MKLPSPVRRLLVFTAAATILLCGASPFAPQAADGANTLPVEETAEAVLTQGLEMIHENARLALYFDSADCTIAVENKADHSLTYSSPLGWQDNDNIDTVQRPVLGSFLIVGSADAGGTKYSANSMIASVRRGGAAAYRQPDGLKIVFDFPRESEQYTIPVEVSLEADALRVTLLYDEIREYGDVSITDIQLLPAFGAGNTTEDGYLFIPDGSGFITRFDDLKTLADAYAQPVYGRDRTLTALTRTNIPEAIRLPVFGVKRGGAAFLAVLTQGEALASIVATPAVKANAYATVSARFHCHQLDTTTLADKDWNYRELHVVHPRIPAVNPCVTYRFLSGDQADYSGMANAYRTYLTETEDLPTATGTAYPAFAEVYGGAKAPASVLGFRCDRLETVTTFGDLETMLADLEAAGIADLHVSLLGFSPGGYADRYAAAGFDRAFGGSGGYRELLSRRPGTVFYPAVDFTVAPHATLTFRETAYAARRVNRDIADVYPYKRSTGALDKTAAKGFLVAPSRLAQLAERYFGVMDAVANQGFHLLGVADMVYGDYSRDRYIDRQQAAGLFEDLLASRRGDGPLLIDGGNLYAMRHASAAVEVPVASTGYRIESVRVPFFTMVFHGLLPLAGPPFNLDGTSEESLLYAAESGLSPLYRLTGRDTYPLADTALNTLCNTAYTHWTADFAQAYRRLRTLIGDLQGETIVHHTYAGELSVCRYSNGAEVAVNFSTQPQTYAGQTVPGRAAVRIH